MSPSGDGCQRLFYCYPDSLTGPGVLMTELEFYPKLLAGLKHMSAFEDPAAQVRSTKESVILHCELEGGIGKCAYPDYFILSERASIQRI